MDLKALDALPPHLRPPTQVPESYALKASNSTGAPSSSEEDWARIETPQDLWKWAQKRWDEGVLPHIEELRWRLGWTIAVWVLAIGGSYFIAKPALHHLQRLAPSATQFVQQAPTDALLGIFQIMLLIGSVLTLPIALWHGCRFLLPALTLEERAWLLPALGLATGGGLIGGVFGYFAVLPLTLQVLFQFSEGVAVPQMSLLPYIGFAVTLIGVMSLTFQMPLLAFLLGRLKLLKRATLKRYWKESFVGMLLIAAVATPSQDPITLILVAGAMYLLYGVCFLVTPVV